MTVILRRDAALLDEDEERPRSLAESPLPVSPAVREALVRAAGEARLERYPDVRPARLEEALARRHGVERDRIAVCGAGSIELLARCVRAFTGPGEAVCAVPPTFDRLPAVVARERRVPCLVPAIPGEAALVYRASPNNPDSRVTSADELARLRRSLLPEAVLVLDRAWAGWESEDELWSLPPLERDGSIVVLFSLSKLFGLAGLRLGWAVAPGALAAELRRYSPGYEVSALVEAAALAALDDRAQREASRALVRASRERLADELTRRGWRVMSSTTHVLVAFPPAKMLEAIDALELPMEACPGIDGAVQLTVPLPEELDGWLARLDGHGRRDRQAKKTRATS